MEGGGHYSAGEGKFCDAAVHTSGMAVGILQQEALEAEKETYSFRILAGQCSASSLSPLFYE